MGPSRPVSGALFKKRQKRNQTNRHTPAKKKRGKKRRGNTTHPRSFGQGVLFQELPACGFGPVPVSPSLRLSRGEGPYSAPLERNSSVECTVSRNFRSFRSSPRTFHTSLKGEGEAWGVGEGEGRGGIGGSGEPPEFCMDTFFLCTPPPTP